MSKPSRVWYSFKGERYTGKNPAFYDLSGTEWYDRLKNDLPQVREKLLTFLKLDGLHIEEYFNKSMVEGTRWETVSFMFWKLRNETLIDKGKDVFEHFNNIPGMVALSVSILQPKTHIKGHYGDTDAIYRFHIPIYIPAPLPDCGLTVGGITKPWVENDMIVFCDACFHEAWNMTDTPRIIMIMDVIKEEFLPKTDQICSNVLSSLKYQHFSSKYKFIRSLPHWIKSMLRESLKLYPVDIYKKYKQ